MKLSGQRATKIITKPDHEIDMSTLYTASLAVLFLCLRPTVFGEIWSLYVAALIVIISFALAPQILTTWSLNTLSKYNTSIFLYVIIVTYLTITGLISGGIHAENSFKFFMTAIASVLSISLIIGSAKHQAVLFDSFFWIITLVSASVVCTMCLLYAGLSPSSIQVGFLEYTYRGRGQILFPFTFSYNVVDSFLGAVPRLSGIFREPGILPAFCCWAAAYAFARSKSATWIAINLLGSVFSLSSLGIPLALYTGYIILLLSFRAKLIIIIPSLIILLAASWPILYSLDDIGIGSKVLGDSISFRERLYLLQISLTADNILFGDGLRQVYRANEGVNLIAQIRLFGIFYFFLVVFLYATSARSFKFFITGIAPLLLTVMFSQPFAVDVPALLIVLSGCFVGAQSNFGAKRLGVDTSSRKPRYAVARATPS